MDSHRAMIGPADAPKELGQLDRRENMAQLAFELDSFMLCVNFAFLFSVTRKPSHAAGKLFGSGWQERCR
jgi:hypothetical protein